MRALIIRKCDRVIIGIHEDPIEIIGASIKGKDWIVEGINLVEAEILVVNTQEKYSVGHVVSRDVKDYKRRYIKATYDDIINNIKELNSRMSFLEKLFIKGE